MWRSHHSTEERSAPRLRQGESRLSLFSKSSGGAEAPQHESPFTSPQSSRRRWNPFQRSASEHEEDGGGGGEVHDEARESLRNLRLLAKCSGGRARSRVGRRQLELAASPHRVRCVSCARAVHRHDRMRTSKNGFGSGGENGFGHTRKRADTGETAK